LVGFQNKIHRAVAQPLAYSEEGLEGFKPPPPNLRIF